MYSVCVTKPIDNSIHRVDGLENHLDSVVCSGFEESIFDCRLQHGENCSVSVGIECSKSTQYVCVGH